MLIIKQNIIELMTKMLIHQNNLMSMIDPFFKCDLWFNF